MMLIAAMSSPFVLNLLVALVVTICLSGWFWAVGRMSHHHPILDWQPRRLVPWGLLDIVLGVVALLFIQICVSLLLKSFGELDLAASIDKMPADDRTLLLAADAITKISSVAILLVWLVTRRHATLHDLGWSQRHVQGDLVVGVTAFVMLVCPVMAIQAILNHLELIPGEHPIMKIWHDSPSVWQRFAIVVTAVVVAPVVEEFFFRVLLQGWLENVSFAIPRVLRNRARPSENLIDSNDNGNDRLAHEGSVEFLLLGRDAVRDASASSTTLCALTGLPRRARLTPILCTSLLFATAHWGHGPAPIPLFLLALGLGYLYQRTHRILPCIMVHMLLNGLSVSLLFFVEAPNAG